MVTVENSHQPFKDEFDESIECMNIDIGDLKLSISKLESVSASLSDNNGNGRISSLFVGNTDNFLPFFNELKNRKLEESSIIT